MPNPLMQMMNNSNVFQNNPIMNIIQTMRSGKDPTALLNQIALQNPQVKPILDMMNNRDEQGLKNMAEKMAKEKGVSLENIASQLGISLPK